MRLMGLEAIYRAPRTSVPHPDHRVYPYLLKGLALDRPNQVWCADITYIPVQRGFLYLVAVMALRQAQEGEPSCARLAAVEHA
jgi:putative transposase